MAKKIAPLDFYQSKFNDSFSLLYQELDKIDAEDDEDRRQKKITIDFLDNLALLLDEIVFHQKKQIKKTKKTKKK